MNQTASSPIIHSVARTRVLPMAAFLRDAIADQFKKAINFTEILTYCTKLYPASRLFPPECGRRGSLQSRMCSRKLKKDLWSAFTAGASRTGEDYSQPSRPNLTGIDSELHRSQTMKGISVNSILASVWSILRGRPTTSRSINH